MQTESGRIRLNFPQKRSRPKQVVIHLARPQQPKAEFQESADPDPPPFHGLMALFDLLHCLYTCGWCLNSKLQDLKPTLLPLTIFPFSWKQWQQVLKLIVPCQFTVLAITYEW